MATRSIFLVVLLAVISPFLYDRYVAFSSLFANRPGKLRNINLSKSHEVKFRNAVRNCEDLLIEESMGVAFLSCDPGRDRWNTVMGTFSPPVKGRENQQEGLIWIYDYSTPDLPESKAVMPLIVTNLDAPMDLHPIGLDFDATTSTLYVVNHRRYSGSAIEVFQVSVSAGTAQHIKTFKHPLIPAPNSVHSLGDGKLLVTNDHFMRAGFSPILSKIETFAAIPGGSVVYTNIHKPEETKTLARLAFANGITMLNSTTVAVASTSKPAIYLYTMDTSDHSLVLNKYIRVPAAVDNLSVDSNGKLLMAGHPFGLAVSKVAEGRPKCNLNGDEEEKKACECTSPSWAAEWSEEGGLREIYQDSGAEFCTSCTFARDVKRGVSLVSGLYDRGILVLNE